MTSSFELRDGLERMVLADLLGPFDGPEEVVDERYVRDRYLVGLLAPRGQSATPEQLDDLAQGGMDEEDGAAEAAPAPAVAMVPSSIGLTYAVDGAAEALQITARWGRYERVEVDDEKYRNRDGSLRLVWRRIPVEGVSEPIPLRAGRLADWSPSPEQPDVLVQGLVRKLDGQWIVTLFLVNGQEEPKRRKDEAWVFQPELVVEAPDGSAIFQKRAASLLSAEPEVQAMAMLYRHSVEFATGHGIAVQAELAAGCHDRAVRLYTQVVPSYEVPQITSPSPDEIPELKGLVLDMGELSSLPDGQFAARLTPLATAYGAWIASLEARLQAPSPDLLPYLGVGQTALQRCRRTLARIREGIDLLDADPQAAEAFRFANQAMALQRVHTLFAAEARRGGRPDLAAIDVPENHSWRAFQLAFILLNLPGLTHLDHPDRSSISSEAEARSGTEATADLLWFPTAGGKTEAYLGLAAYAMGLRRLQGVVGGRSGHAGVAVLMRYTLRLLTLQQFQRAAALLCACEIIRRDNAERWGNEPFRIGLWVGRRTTPNTTADAEQAVRDLRHGGAGGAGGTPHQLTNCPWCGAEINPGRDIVVETLTHGRGRTFIYCGDPAGQCPFTRRLSPDEGIPALVVDEEIYRRLPSLLIATVDKFAQMPWNGCTAMLFGQVNGYCERHGYRSPELDDSDHHPARHGLPRARTLPAGPLRPPDLIIQDELHLISGPLGTLVGLYESAVDRLAAWEVDGRLVRPKIIASTATVRRAEGQVHSLFLRRVQVFPPHGLDAADSFFSRERAPGPEFPGRRYLGVCATGIRHKTALIRAYVAFLSAAQQLFDQSGAASDPWMTMVGYFNSLRELGSMRRAVEDSITTRLQRMDRRGLARRTLSPYRTAELTSRLSATDIPDILDRLERTFGEPPGRDYPIDVLLATNMVSVGVDVGRLGLMIVACQPKSTAEYIQATSRVGRRFPGLVCTVYNWARPRDLSHYERFAHYHATFYQHVEALSVTPFSPRALDRGLSAVAVSLVRLLGLELNANSGAGQFLRDHPHAREAVAQIVHRASQIDGNERAQLVQQGLAARLDEWQHRATAVNVGARLGYKEQRDGVTVGLLQAPEQGGFGLFTCLNSLRDVELPVNLTLDDGGLDAEAPPPWSFGPVTPPTEEGEEEGS